MPQKTILIGCQRWSSRKAELEDWPIKGPYQGHFCRPHQKTVMNGWSSKVMCYTLSRKYLKTMLAASTCYEAVGRSENVERASPIDLFINDTLSRVAFFAPSDLKESIKFNYFCIFFNYLKEA